MGKWLKRFELQIYLLRHMSVFSWNSISLRMFMTTVLLVAIPLLVTSVYGFLTYSRETERQMFSSFEQVSDQVRDQIDNMIQQSYNSMAALELSFDLGYLLQIGSGEWSNNVSEYYNVSNQIRTLFSWQQGVRGVFVISADGGVIHEYTHGLLERDYPFKEQHFFQESQTTKQFLLSGPHPQDYVDYGRVFSIDKPLYDAVTKEFIGVIRLDIDVETFYRFFDNITLFEHGDFMVMNGSGTIIYHPDKSQIGRLSDEAIMGMIGSGVAKGSGSLTLDGTDTLIAFNTSKLTDWKLVGSEPKDDIYSSVYQIRDTMLWLGALTFVAIVLFTAMMILFILKPLYRLNRGMIKIGGGDFSLRLSTKAPTELKVTIEQYNLAVQQLKALTEELFVSRLRQQEAEIASQQSQIESQALEMKRQEADLRQREAEMSQLQAQINPHFIYNTLSSIDSMAEVDETEGIKDAVKHLSHMLRYAVKSGGFLVPIDEELAHVNAFVSIQNLRYGRRIRFELDIQGHVSRERIIRLTLQPLVENAYFHGLEPKLGGGVIRLSLAAVDSHIYISLQDDGVGIQQEELERLKQFIQSQHSAEEFLSETHERYSGLRNVIRRLALTYKKRLRVSIESEWDRGTRIDIAIPRVEKQ